MSLSYAILAFLAEFSSSGYELGKHFDSSVGYFWSATHQQIYRELHKLEALEWICAETIAQSSRPDKKVFSITDTGKEHLRKWISQPSSISATKEEILVKIFAGNLVPKSTIIQDLHNLHHLHEERLKVYREIETQYFSDVNSGTDAQKFQYLTLRRGIRLEEDWMAWCNEAINFLGENQ